MILEHFHSEDYVETSLFRRPPALSSPEPHTKSVTLSRPSDADYAVAVMDALCIDINRPKLCCRSLSREIKGVIAGTTSNVQKRITS